ncbi:putative cell morphogenesis protein [Phaeomoniella chlamydospora]|uniref:Putative cell morphogenesis protein n=1 Tax=Phaeomoniella chlamydospora TaxID=158046 RepID=A0A0G2EZE1_PHACM|nr:putative cell morphogenesis protein [Phaeomoniella chlamydospora]
MAAERENGLMANGVGGLHRKTLSTKSRRGHAHHRSRSKYSEPRSAGEFALHHLLNAFVAQADHKIDQAIRNVGDLSAPVELICGPGVDPAFDQLLSALGHVARQKPKPLVDSLMFWRKNKGELATLAKQQLAQQQFPQPRPPAMPAALHRRNTEPSQAPGDATDSHADVESGGGTGLTPTPVDEVAVAEKRATVSVYLVCRVLVEVYEQSSMEQITEDLSQRLEEIVFGQLKSVDPGQLANSTLRMANWRIYTILLGRMSRVSFGTVTTKFLIELDNLQKEIARNTGNLLAKEAEARAELLIHGMRHIQIRTQPEPAWIQSCEFIRNVSTLFVNAHGATIKQSYCHIVEKLLLPIAADRTTDLGLQQWRECLELLGPRVGQMLTKPRHWNAAFPPSAALLCISPKETFLAQWLPMITNLTSKLKDRNTRGMALQAICRLTWTYIYRFVESSTGTTRKLEDVIRVALPQGRRTHLSTEPSTADPLIHLIRIIGFRFPDLCFRSIIFPMLNADLICSGKEVKLEQLEPEKIAIGIKAALATMADMQDRSLHCSPFTTPLAPVVSLESIPLSPTFFRQQLLADPRPYQAVAGEEHVKLIVTRGFSDTMKQYYARFCEFLGKLSILCDSTFGGQAAINEKFGTFSPVPKTPRADAFAFAKKDDPSGFDYRQSFYDLLLVAVQALPKCLSDNTPLSSIISLLCTGTAHLQSNIAISSAQSLKSIARQGHAQQVTSGFSNFIFNFDKQYSTMSDDGMLGPGHIENTLALYVELLQIFIDQVRQRNKEAVADVVEKKGIGNRGLQLDLSNALHQVDHVESHGLFFLCSQSRRVRSFAIKVLSLVIELDKALGKQNSRVIRILEEDYSKIFDLNDDHLSVAERTRMQQGKRKVPNNTTLIDICSSEVSYDYSLWGKIFPNLIRSIQDTCPFAITLAREHVNAKLVQMWPSIESLSKSSVQRTPQVGSPDYRTPRRTTPPEILIEQWKLYLVMSCVTMSSVGAQSQSQLDNAAHARKVSKGDQSAIDNMSSARRLFSTTIPVLEANSTPIRSATVLALGSINTKLYRTLLESLQYAVIKCTDEAKNKIGVHQRTPSSPVRNRSTEILRTEVTHLYKITASFLKDPEVYNDEWVLNNIVTYAKDLRLFLSDTEVQSDWEFQSLRLHYCGLIEEVFEGILRTNEPARWMPFESRKSAFALMEEWCGYSPHQTQIAQREDAMKQAAIANQNEAGERANFTASIEIERRHLKVAALSAMATLCQGPISITTENQVVLSFHVPRMLSWIEAIFATPADRYQIIGRRALKNLVVYNREFPALLEHSIDRCYASNSPKIFESYFKVITEVLIEHSDYQLPFWRVLALVLFTLGSENRDIRMHSAKLLRILEERQQKSSKLQDFDISISDKTTAVYKLAQFEYSKRLSKAHSELAFIIFSEFSLQFKKVTTDYQRNMVAAILPWIQAIELQIDPNGGPTTLSSMLLSNLFEITVRHSTTLHNEVQALWQALATGPHGGNVQLVLDYIFSLCLDRREQNFVDYAKQVVVYLSSTPAGSKVIEFFLLQMVPKHMVQERRGQRLPPPEIKGLPYVCDLGEILPTENKQAGFSLGQISLIFLVDLMVAPISLSTENAIKIIHVSMILWDHYNQTVREHSREMLVHLLHELVTSKLDDVTLHAHGKKIEALVDAIRESLPNVIWSYDDTNGKDEDDHGRRVPQPMSQLTKEVIGLFSMVHSNFGDLWAKEALSWASSCPVRHLACRSFQIFRCVSVTVDSRMLADMLARLSNTIADEETDYQTFSLEILTTLKIIIDSLLEKDLLRYPQLFWTTCACLNTIHEGEFIESMAMLERLIARLDLSDPNTVKILMDNQPLKWEGSFEGIHPLIFKGLKSAEGMDHTLSVLNQVIALRSNMITGDNSRLLFTVLANLPRFLHHFDLDQTERTTLDCALQLGNNADEMGYGAIAQTLSKFANNQYASSSEFLNVSLNAVEACFFPDLDAKSLIFLMGLLFNKTTWYRIKVMQILCVVIPRVDMKKAEISCHGPELITPLMRLLVTDLCPQALEVMDNIMEVSGNPLEKEHIRMSMASGSARAIRKEYSHTQSLYGIPAQSGWSIPMPAIHSRTTRNNVHAVFYSCADTETHHEVAETPEIEFHTEEFSDSYFPPRRTGTLKSVETTADNNMGDLISKLDSLDDFFDDPGLDEPQTPGGTIRGFQVDLHEHGANIYDQQTAPILSRSLARTASTSSFHNGLAESSRPAAPFYSRDHSIMNPGAFVTDGSPSSQLISPVAAPGRPTLHGRSITSPPTNLPMLQEVSYPSTSKAPSSLPKNSFSDDEDTSAYYEDNDAVLSDTETPFPTLATIPTNHTMSPTYHSMHTPPSATTGGGGNANPFSFEGMRRGMRRLTGGRERDRGDRLRSRGVSPSPSLGASSSALPLSSSPRVPKVPAEYLNGTNVPGTSSPNL